MLEDIEDTLCDLKDTLESIGGLILAALLFVGIGVYFMFALDPATTLLILTVVGTVFAAIICYRIVSFFTGD
jgi:Kef-type K+ transport system membrane component KefB